MRRKDREVTDTTEIQSILSLCKTCHLAMIDGDTPYVIPLNFGYVLNGGTLTLYFHSAKEGRKTDILKKNNRVCFEMCLEGEPIFAEKTPCNSGYYYSCVHGFGKAEFITEPPEKCAALTNIVQHQAGVAPMFTPAQANSVCVYKVTTSDFTAKRKPHHMR